MKSSYDPLVHTVLHIVKISNNWVNDRGDWIFGITYYIICHMYCIFLAVYKFIYLWLFKKISICQLSTIIQTWPDFGHKIKLWKEGYFLVFFWSWKCSAFRKIYFCIIKAYSCKKKLKSNFRVLGIAKFQISHNMMILETDTYRSMRLYMKSIWNF